ncbi:MAG: hypothetical protein WBO12_13920, partial [Xanthobacteraceae bacterium]
NTVSVLIVFYAALFPMLLNTWSGVRAVNPIWLRAASAMGANEPRRGSNRQSATHSGLMSAAAMIA